MLPNHGKTSDFSLVFLLLLLQPQQVSCKLWQGSAMSWLCISDLPPPVRPPPIGSVCVTTLTAGQQKKKSGNNNLEIMHGVLVL